MSTNDLKRFQDANESVRAPWVRPTLRRLEANEARGGDNPGNDGKGGGSGSGGQHS